MSSKLNKNHTTLIRFTFFQILALLTFVSYAQTTGKISGVVIDKTTAEELIGATVIIEGTSIGSSTGIEGDFVIANVTPGIYKLKVSYIGYDGRIIEGVEVKAGETTTVNIALSETVGELEAIEIVAFAKTNTESAVLLEIKQTDQMASGVSAQQIARSLDRDAGQVVRRVPGITLYGDFINIRGLNPRYNNVLLQNIVAPSLETDIKSFSFDMIPSGQIDRIIILKSPAADVTGDFAGGVVRVYTKSIPNETSYQVSYTTSVRAGTTFNDFYGGERNALFALGINNYDGLPSGFPQNLRRSSASELVSAGRSLRNNWIANQGTAIPDQRISFNMNHRIQGKRALIGHISAINYSFTNATFNIDRADYNDYDIQNDQSFPVYDFNDMQYTTSSRLGVIHNWAFRFKKGNLIEFKNIANFSAQNQYIYRTGEHYEFNYFPDNHSFDQTARGLYAGQLLGKHDLQSGAGVLSWYTGFSTSYRNQPDYKRYRADRDTSSGDIQLFIPVGNAQPNFLGRFYSEMTEYIASGGATYSYTLGYNKSKSFLPVFTIGTNNEYKSREFTARNIGFIRSPQFDLNLLYVGIDELFQEENINTTTGVTLDEQSNPSDSYTASNLLSATFAKIELPIQKLKIVAGVRYEYFRQQLSSADLTNRPIEVNRPNNFILPSLNLSYSFSNKTLVRAAYGMSVNNPEFREMAPFGFYDFNYNFTFAGNPNIKSSTIHNAELKWELYPIPSDVINVSVFYKRFFNPIEVVVELGSGGSGGAKSFSFQNAQSANLYGAEVELKKSFPDASSKFIKRTGVMFNASYIKSLIQLGEVGGGQSDDRPLQGQAPYLVNGGVFFGDREKGYQINVLYNVVGPRIMFVGFDSYPDIYELPRSLLDISASYEFKNGLALTAGVSDVLNAETVWIQDGNANGKLERNKDQRIQTFRPGSVFSIGAKFNFK
jgi:outer membrane receptor for ferrienterochelin and colicin